ncbi:hypothetical protein [Trinickia soli]|uniref:DUF4347 domain-containing protein n=1 Tax=Trinickia soli TaxID=380675 RepID=A0A2N7W8I2_9BURK|nr:hypothetical protein [Trinickia soli]KAA0082317.1 hypothetical protein CIW54_20810 [Paraburkholderia sp. T12-10]PMS25711.1 hypothetical protein C0Z19_09110 [Trinickia soli]CAB3640857.1 hypothetical protein LMG24076_00263 [Trinickia soli]
MFDIITTEPDDSAVQTAINTVAQDKSNVVSAKGSYVLTTPTASHTEGGGGEDRNVLVIIGHGSANSLSDCQTWACYKKQFSHLNIEWDKKTSVYIVSCSTAGQSYSAFVHGNFAREVKATFPEATVWASSTPVNARTLEGDWEKL